MKSFMSTRKLVALFLLWGQSLASPATLVDEFLLGNSAVVEAKARNRLSALEEAQVRAAKSWGIGFSGNYYKNELDGTILKSATRNYAMSLSKDFLWGGHFAFSSGHGKVDTYANAFMPQDTSNYEFTQTVSYVQDFGRNFFGLGDRQEIRIARQGAALENARVEYEISGKLLDFYMGMVEMRLNKTMVELEDKALSRAIRRTKMIRKRVRDGLRERVDLYQAEMVELGRKEEVKGAILKRDQSISNVSNLLHRKVLEHEVEIFKEDQTAAVSKAHWEKSRHEKFLKKKIDFIKGNLERVYTSFIPQISLNTHYKTNSYDQNGSDAFKNGSFGNDKAEFAVGLNVSFPLWFGPQRVEKERLQVELTTAQAVYEKGQRSFLEQERLLRNQIEVLNRNIDSAQERVVLAKKVLVEYNKLYDLGRADLDQVIRSEEDLINTEKSYVTYLARKEGLVSNLAFLCGILVQHLRERK